ncbi:TIGR00659 family protein [Halanaerobium congolense]|jgi:predicted murein hydrolase (TIGR00659 family)|uniref:Putative murein hydrolase (TIGR00659 family) n=1 Tax=Halanaerobium congolense TaxID=54121 RepID=A0A1G8S6C0_9FIRM|nr:LrgB family protein [Halanaerobium congolense]PUU87747.1 MAG: LrgB family protein [Halanaerobium sp.]TDS26852.1 putative murein hydrolase (TIGR00659 family) [Halanaerobium congolense]SDJ24778.1 TIGR00659 family protein [Halanaerobium congolense]SET75856.1 TIGR00659 family protein [Halanaerobium congolense]
MKELINTPYFGLIISILTFELGIYLNKKTKLSLFNPLLVSIVLTIFILTNFNIDLETYNKGGDLLSFFLGPAIVILAVPLYHKIELLKANYKAILIGISAGTLTGILTIIYLTNLFNLDLGISLALIPKSVTTPIGIEICNQIGGISSITVAASITTGILGSVIGPFICKLFGIKNKVAVGVAIGTSSHAVGTSRAIEIGETEGAMSGLAIGIAGLITVFLVPILLIIF